MRIFSVKRHSLRTRCHFDATMLMYKHFEIFFENDTHERSEPSQLVLGRKWRRQTKTRRTYTLFKFFSIRIDAYRHILPIEMNRTLQECF